MNFSIAVLPGDGIGPEVISEAVKVMQAVETRFDHDFDISYGRVGGNAIDDFGTPLPAETQEMCAQTDAILFGAVGRPPMGRPARQNPPRRRHTSHPQKPRPLRQHPPRQSLSPAHQLQPHQTPPAARRGYDNRPRTHRRLVLRQAPKNAGIPPAAAAAWTPSNTPSAKSSAYSAWASN